MKTARPIAFGLALPLTLFVAYAIWTSTTSSPYFPSPVRIAERFQELWLFDRFASDVLPSLRNLLLGYFIAVAVSIVVGVALGRVRILRLLFTPLLDFARSIPVIMLIPPFVLLLGIGDMSKLALGAGRFLRSGGSFCLGFKGGTGGVAQDPMRVSSGRVVG